MLVQLKKHLYQLLIVLAGMVFFISCQKDINDPGNNNPNPTNETPDLTTKVNSSASGFVVDENNLPVENALVQFGSGTASTDEYGFFEIKNMQVVKTAAVVAVTKIGYFKAIKTYSATADKAAFFRIKLIPKTTAGTINGSSGGNITLSNGLIIALPANGVMLASGSTPYSGDVNVAAFWINPEAADLNEIMPGDLRGIDNSGFIKGLTTYGMAAVELTGTGGELLQIATGKKATITMPLSSLLSAAAPTSIPLWYFDESNGLWKEDGSALRTGNTYVGEVSHFSYWNCDLPNAIVPLTFTVVDGSGNPLANAHVEISPVPGSPNSWSHTGGFTDGTGYVSVFVTPNTTYDLEIYGTCNYYSGTPSYTQTFTVTTTAVDLGNITISAAVTATVSGTLTNCSGNPVTNGFLILQQGYFYTRYPVDNTGSYNFTTTICNGSLTVNLIGEDLTGGQQSTSVAHTLVAGNNNIGNIQACGVTTSEFINYSIDGGTTFTTLTYPADSLYHSGNGTSNVFYIAGSSMPGAPANNNVQFVIDNLSIATGTTQALISFSSSNIADQPTVTTPIDVNITEYGAVGEYIAGNFTGTITGMAPTNTPYPIVCNFRVKRSF